MLHTILVSLSPQGHVYFLLCLFVNDFFYRLPTTITVTSSCPWKVISTGQSFNALQMALGWLGVVEVNRLPTSESIGSQTTENLSYSETRSNEAFRYIISVLGGIVDHC